MILLTVCRALEYGEGRQRAIVHFNDLPRLDEEEYLNDSLIDFYMMYVVTISAHGIADAVKLSLPKTPSSC